MNLVNDPRKCFAIITGNLRLLLQSLCFLWFVHWVAIDWAIFSRSQAQTSSGAAFSREDYPLRRVDSRQATLSGIRKLTGKHLTLYTDVPSCPAVDELPAVFDEAVPQWATYFGLDLALVADWHVQGYLIVDRQRFARLHLLPETKVRFENGYAQGNELWFLEQSTDYYRRHLLLHEGTHAFMWTQLGGYGSPWYMEGMAEMFATHQWLGGKEAGERLLLNQMPKSRLQVPAWGRIQLIQDAYQGQQPLSVSEVMQLGRQERMSTPQYAWCWALVKLLDSHPRFQSNFRKLPRIAMQKDFQSHFHRLFQPEISELQLQWRSLIATFDYGYDFRAMAVPSAPLSALGSLSDTRSIAADRGWQSTGWQLTAGKTYRLTAKGRYVIAHASGVDRERLASEPGGITLEYHSGYPLGQLLATLVPAGDRRGLDASTSGSPTDETLVSSWFVPSALGLGGSITPTRDAILYLRVNQSPAHLADNQGSMEVTIQATTKPPKGQ